MSNIQDISKQPLIEWNSQVVITTAQLADVYGTTAGNISDNFKRNENRFEQGKHFILLEGEKLREFKNCSAESGLVAKNARQLYLWTRRGASRHCKILGTDKAWEQFDYLEENYFDRQEQKQSAPPLTLQQQIQTIAKGTDELYQRVDAVTEEVQTVRSELQNLKDGMPVFQTDAKDIQDALRKKAIETLGGKDSNAYHDKSIHGYAFADIQMELRRQFDVKRYDQIKHKDVADALKVIEEYKPPIHIRDKIAMSNAQQRLDV